MNPCLYTTVSESDFRNMFLAIRPDNFTYRGLTALYEYLWDLAEESGEPVEVDAIAICCDYCEVTQEDLDASDDILADTFGEDWRDRIVAEVDGGGYIIHG